MKLIVCNKNIDDSLQRGDVIEAFQDGFFEGESVGLHNVLKYGKDNKDSYILTTPFTILNLPLVTYEDVQPIFEDVTLVPNNIPFIDDNFTPVRKWKLGIDNLELRELNSYYDLNDPSPEKTRWLEVLPEPIRRDTLIAYNEITLPSTVIADILVAR